MRTLADSIKKDNKKLSPFENEARSKKNKEEWG